MTTFTQVIAADEIKWELRRDKQDIQVYVGEADESDYMAFKAISRIKTTMPSLVNLMRDIAVMDQWLETCNEPLVIDEPDKASRVIHMKNNSPFFLVADRDLVILQRFRRITDNVVIVDLIDRSEQLEETPGHVRGEFNGHWLFTHINDSEIEVEYHGLADPNGKVAPWMANLVVLDVPYKTLKNIRNLLHDKETKYNRPFSIPVADHF